MHIASIQIGDVFIGVHRKLHECGVFGRAFWPRTPRLHGWSSWLVKLLFFRCTLAGKHKVLRRPHSILPPNMAAMQRRPLMENAQYQRSWLEPISQGFFVVVSHMACGWAAMVCLRKQSKRAAFLCLYDTQNPINLFRAAITAGFRSITTTNWHRGRSWDCMSDCDTVFSLGWQK